MKEFNWKIIFTFQVLLIVLVSGVLSFKMGLFEDLMGEITINGKEVKNQNV